MEGRHNPHTEMISSLLHPSVNGAKNGHRPRAFLEMKGFTIQYQTTFLFDLLED